MESIIQNFHGMYQEENDDDQDEGAGEASSSNGGSGNEDHTMFDKYDKDGNGEITWEELEDYVSSVNKEASLEEMQVWLQVS